MQNRKKKRTLISLNISKDTFQKLKADTKNYESIEFEVANA